MCIKDSSLGLLPKYLTFFETNKTDTFSAATESNAQRNKPSLRGKKSSGVTHFRKSHLIRCGVVMDM